MAKESNIVYDAVTEFPLGVNSGLDAWSVPSNQLSFAVNSTVRGNFVTNRPPFQIQNVSFPSLEVQTAVTTGLFQGAGYYAPASGQQQIAAQIGGRLFLFTPDPSGLLAACTEISIPGDFNSPSQPQAWLIQASTFLIVQNGLANPIFYDGVTSRRSLPTSTVQGITDLASQPFTPLLNGTMVFTMTAPYTGVVNQTVAVVEYDNNDVITATSFYVVTAVGGATTTYNITLKNLGDLSGANQLLGSALVIQPALIGNVSGFSAISPVTGNATASLILSSAAGSFVVVGGLLSIDGDSAWKITAISSNRKTLSLTHPNNGGLPFSINVSDPVYYPGNTSPNVTVGNLNANFIAPAVGATVPTVLAAAYTFPIGQILFINNKQYQVTAYNPVFVPGFANTITLQNLNDTRQPHQFNPVGTVNPTQILNLPELPPGRMMAYGGSRVAVALPDGISFMLGDLIGTSSGSPAYNYRDAVLKASENSDLPNGGAFNVPSNNGQITSLRNTAQLDASLGQGQLMVVTPGGIFSVNLSIDRSTWSNPSSPILPEALIGLGGLGQNSTIPVNGDLLFRAVDGIRSLIMAKREFYSWGNTPISFEMKRVLDKDNVAGLSFGSAVQFDNRMLMTCAPTQGSQGVYHPGLIALNFDTVSGIQGKSASVYDGLWDGINTLQILEGQFSGVHRCFAFSFSTTQNKIEFYELLKTGTLDNGTTPITWSFEMPVMLKSSKQKGLFDYCRLNDGEIYVSDIQPGQKIYFKADYRPDFSGCWFDWNKFFLCNDITSLQPLYGTRLGLGTPSPKKCNTANNTTSIFGYWFQVRMTISGHCVFKAFKMGAMIDPIPPDAVPVCNDENPIT